MHDAILEDVGCSKRVHTVLDGGVAVDRVRIPEDGLAKVLKKLRLRYFHTFY